MTPETDMLALDATVEGELVRIGELARRVALSPHVLRAWERRYGLLTPIRTDSGYRLYSAADEARIRDMRARVARGAAPAEAAEAIRRAVRSGAQRAAPHQSDPIAELRSAMTAFDEAAVETIFDGVVTTVGSDALIAAVLIPFLRGVGERWARAETTIAQEHFVSTSVRRRLGQLIPARPATGPKALLACPPGELHDLPLAMTAVTLSTRGWRVTLLGADTPIASVGEVADQLTPDIVVLASPFAERFGAAARDLTRIAKRHPIALGGSGASAAHATRIGATHLTGDPVQAAAALTSDHGKGR